jgi:hypothetical protein
MSLHRAIIKAVEKGTAKWAKQRKREERDASALANRQARLIRASDFYNFKSAAYEVMEEAYMAASAGGTLPASARQVMYQARPLIQDKMNGEQLNDEYFCQRLLPDYMSEHEVDWDVVYDDRGHFAEPHTGRAIGLGTIAVRDYLSSIGKPTWDEPSVEIGGCVTHGPQDRFGAVLFIEKEGFTPLFEAVNLAERYDLAPMSTKGVSNTAARRLVDEICGAGIPLLVLHDFDKAGFSILGTLQRDTRRYAFRGSAKVIDLGLRLQDVHDLDLLESAEEVFDRGAASARRKNLRANGATEEEAEFLLHRRVELNALTSDQLVAFIERKLVEHGIGKVIPDKETLAEQYRVHVRAHAIERAIGEILTRDLEDEIEVPGDIRDKVIALLNEEPQLSWDEAIARIAEP